MTTIKFDRFARILIRCKEVGTQTGICSPIANFYAKSTAEPVGAYLGADSDVTNASIACEKKKNDAVNSLIALNDPYKVARTMLKSIHPETEKVLPDTLKALPTDTDKLKAIKWLYDEISKDAGEVWADDLITGEFGTKATMAMDDINGVITAGKALTKASMNRAAAYEPTYAKYLHFKQVVRDALGTGSKEYRRIHLRALPGSATEEPEAAPAEPKAGALEAQPASKAVPSGAPAMPAADAPPAAPLAPS